MQGPRQAYRMIASRRRFPFYNVFVTWCPGTGFNAWNFAARPLCTLVSLQLDLGNRGQITIVMFGADTNDLYTFPIYLAYSFCGLGVNIHP